MDRRRISRLTLSLLLPVLAVGALLVINEVGFRRSSQALEAIAQAAHTRSTLNRLLQQMLDAETGSRGYLLTGEARYLAPYSAAVGEVGETLAVLARAYP